MNEPVDLSTPVIFLIPVAFVIGIFTWLAVVGFARERRKERETLYRHETARKLVESGGMDFAQFQAFEEAEVERPLRARRRALSLAGSVLVLAGLAFWLALRSMGPEEGVVDDTGEDLSRIAALGFVPLAIGAALLLNAGTGKRGRETRGG